MAPVPPSASLQKCSSLRRAHDYSRYDSSGPSRTPCTTFIFNILTTSSHSLTNSSLNFCCVPPLTLPPLFSAACCGSF